MRLLLDTQALIWSVGSSSLLAAPARQALEDAANTVVVSVVSLWEAVIKQATGKLVLDEDLAYAARERGFDVLPIREEHARAVADLPLHHRDPFDRMLVAQARHEGLTLVTADRRLEAYSVAVLRADA
ncbi:type II toxin-antitoxin system VapC family toxin [Actinomycetospora sp. CA-101289]|uniref:type II toxin-antitoxin system VapC family toxin n=1 Tax=Actinomycetospora sp. CA-101289 TaxID=3239893 RepID=UPI003D96C959